MGELIIWEHRSLLKHDWMNGWFKVDEERGRAVKKLFGSKLVNTLESTWWTRTSAHDALKRYELVTPNVTVAVIFVC